MEKYDIVFCIQCCEKPQYAARLERVRNYMVPKLQAAIPNCKVLMMLCREEASEDHVEGDTLVLAIPDGYYYLPRKTQRGLEFVHNNYDFKFFARIDDDIDLDIEAFIRLYTVADVSGVQNVNFNKTNYYTYLRKIGYDMTTLKHVKIDSKCPKFNFVSVCLSKYVIKMLYDNFFSKGLMLEDMIPTLDDMALSYAIYNYCPGVSYCLFPYRSKQCHTFYTRKVIKESHI